MDFAGQSIPTPDGWNKHWWDKHWWSEHWWGEPSRRAETARMGGMAENDFIRMA